MYRCENGHVFDENEAICINQHVSGFNVPDGGYDETQTCCPECKSDEIYAVIECDYCGMHFPKFGNEYLYFKEDGDIICNDCLHDYCVDKFGADKFNEF